jgi:hypothetical protein
MKNPKYKRKKYDKFVVDVDYMQRTGVKKLLIWHDYTHQHYWEDITNNSEMSNSPI